MLKILEPQPLETAVAYKKTVYHCNCQVNYTLFYKDKFCQNKQFHVNRWDFFMENKTWHNNILRMKTFVDFRFMLFTKVLVKELARILIHVHKIFNCKVSFKILLLMCPAIIEKKL